ncbi:MAG: hypothetical protein LKJ25_04310 [Clostridia bacterium]|jgi:hypothetical protein|nr:hypothetical protein [Clostridia bacterium]
MGLFGKKKETDKGKKFGGHWGFAIKGINGYEKYTWSATLFPDELVMKCITKGVKDTELALKISSILDAQYSTDIRTFTQSKSSLTKGIVGGALFGVPGAIVGSSPKVKNTTEFHGNILIAYKSSDGETKNIILTDNTVNSFQGSKLCEAIKEKMPKKEPPTGRIEL